MSPELASITMYGFLRARFSAFALKDKMKNVRAKIETIRFERYI